MPLTPSKEDPNFEEELSKKKATDEAMKKGGVIGEENMYKSAPNDPGKFKPSKEDAVAKALAEQQAAEEEANEKRKK